MASLNFDINSIMTGIMESSTQWLASPPSSPLHDANSPGSNPDESRKCRIDEVDGAEETENERFSNPAFTSPAVTQNIVEKRLKVEQKAEIDKFLHEPLLVQLGIIFANQLAAQNEKVNAVATGSTFTVTKVLSDNANKYAIATLLSPKLLSYKGDTPKNLSIRGVLTQAQSNLKKLLRASISSKVKVNGPDGKKIIEWQTLEKDEQQGIYSLMQEMVQLTGGRSASPALCAHVALMIYKNAKGDPLLLRVMFEEILKHDCQNHSVDNSFVILDGESELQASVDEMLESAQSANATLTLPSTSATSAQSQ
ncbi:hypothetical protein GYMLUDRAFT_64348 [Collybiopsis luxurians FD-317 M1]|uniref:Unplaced genomic scaffold GYMLUscaffold_98, whole genome shotgun sequence n=1 Tax=Collybiopsis luxurians FD-317 M1 TaxID=944289 RepID=A0A0D0APL7_9AGAR|nr:hypothetical protein GYMLUDRAFT_64348 [Collybiopsis luxurians FD-317 M1]